MPEYIVLYMLSAQTVREIERLKRRIASLETKAVQNSAKKQKADRKKVATLAKKLGYRSAEELISVLYSGAKAPKAPKAAPAAASPAPADGKRKRARITEEDRASIVAALKQGDLSAAEIAGKFGISLPSVNLIKKAAGLTKSRKTEKKQPKAKKKAEAVPAAEAPAAPAESK